MATQSPRSNPANSILEAAIQLNNALANLTWPNSVQCVYNPLVYAWEPYRDYVQRYAASHKRVLFVGMNPGPWGMAQTGIPFGEVSAVRDWLGISTQVCQPAQIHPKRPITGFHCTRSEVSGRRLWQLFADRFGCAASFFENHFVLNYCPLAFMADSGANLTPDKFPSAIRAPLESACDTHLAQVINTLHPQWIIGVGAFASACASRVILNFNINARVGTILHPSPASPIANKLWPTKPIQQMQEMGLW
ncbi:MAG: single-stranded DNA-binding protein [Verrucomicrobia bacterium]|nr:single-stranded DNA-binding protein [Verrucomicrobiota bacterium]